MPSILIYTTRFCPYCNMAKKLLDKKGVCYTDINIESNLALRQEIMQKTKRRTVPQIFINDVHIGGFDDLYALDISGDLDPLLQPCDPV